MKKIIMMLFFAPLISSAEILVNPAPNNGVVELTSNSTYLYFTNTSSNEESLNLSINQLGFKLVSNRCENKILKKNQNCYLIVQINNSELASGLNLAQIMNGTNPIISVLKEKTTQSEFSIFTQNFLSLNDFTLQDVSIQNKTKTFRNYNPIFSGIDSTKFEIVTNRCQNIKPDGFCRVTIKLKPQSVGTYSVEIIEPQIQNSINISSTITNLTSGVVQPQISSISVSPMSLNFGTLTRYGLSSPQTITITNTGNTFISPIFEFSPKSKIALNRCSKILAGQSCSLSLSLNPDFNTPNGNILGEQVLIKSNSSDLGTAVSFSGVLNVILSCSSNQHQELGTCVSNERSCLILNGTGTQSWSSGSWNTCSIISCNSGFSDNGNGSCQLVVETDLTVTSGHSCKIETDGLGYCWGIGTSGRLGNGLTSNSSVPATVINTGVLSGKTFKKIIAKTSSTCSIASDDNVYCWGSGTNGELGNGASTSSSIPVSVNTSGVLSGKTIKKIEVGSSHFCSIASDDSAYCWGSGTSGQLGNGASVNSNVPVAVNTSGVLSGKTIKKISLSTSSSCAIASDNNAYCWGRNTGGVLGNGSTVNSNVPVAVNTSGVLSGKTIKSIVVDSITNHACVIASDDNAYCWGSGTLGQLGNGSTSASSVPVAVNTSGVLSGKTIKQIEVSDSFACSIASDDKPYCWGAGGNGNLGHGSFGLTSSPVAVNMSGDLSGKTVKTLAISENGSFVCVIASDDKPYCWGSGTLGQLGNGTNTTSSVPVAVNVSGALLGKSIKSIKLGTTHSCVSSTDNSIYCWGAGTSGQLGNGASVNSNVPVLVFP